MVKRTKNNWGSSVQDAINGNHRGRNNIEQVSAVQFPPPLLSLINFQAQSEGLAVVLKQTQQQQSPPPNQQSPVKHNSMQLQREISKVSVSTCVNK